MQLSQASPSGSASASFWSGFGVDGQLSAAQVLAGKPGLPEPSPSVSVQVSAASQIPSASVSTQLTSAGTATANSPSPVAPPVYPAAKTTFRLSLTNTSSRPMSLKCVPAGSAGMFTPVLTRSMPLTN